MKLNLKIEEQINVDKLTEIKKFLFDQGISIDDKILLNGNYKQLTEFNITTIDDILENNEEKFNSICGIVERTKF